jgi:phosphonate transport system substrate-binding protein
MRIGIAPGTWWGLNRNDASAAIAAWTRTILAQRGIDAVVQTRLFETPEALSQALKSGQIDAVSMLTDQFLKLQPDLQPAEIFISSKDHSCTENYELLVPQASGITNVAGLAGRKVVLQANSRTSLAAQWLDTLLARQTLGPAKKFFGALTKIESPSKAVLQVFFHQADACLVTSNVFALACELNPQLRKELRVLAVSPEVVPSLFFFRPGYVSKVRDQLEPSILELNKTPAGQEVLTVFQCDGMIKRPVSCLDGSRQLLTEYGRPQSRTVQVTQAGSMNP